MVSFFEQSAEDVENPIIDRLSSRETTLRRSSDASMVVQAIIDAIIDLAIPVTIHQCVPRCYRRAGAKCFDWWVMAPPPLEFICAPLSNTWPSEPSIENTKPLHILTSEVSQFHANIYPTISLVNALRDHKSQPITTTAVETQSSHPKASGVAISG